MSKINKNNLLLLLPLMGERMVSLIFLYVLDVEIFVSLPNEHVYVYQLDVAYGFYWIYWNQAWFLLWTQILERGGTRTLNGLPSLVELETFSKNEAFSFLVAFVFCLRNCNNDFDEWSTLLRGMVVHLYVSDKPISLADVCCWRFFKNLPSYSSAMVIIIAKLEFTKIL